MYKYNIIVSIYASRQTVSKYVTCVVRSQPCKSDNAGFRLNVVLSAECCSFDRSHEEEASPTYYYNCTTHCVFYIVQ